MSIKLLVMDIDGTLTDGRIYIGNQGELMKAFNVKDGYAITHILPEYGIVPVIITGRQSDIVVNRAKELKIDHLYQGVTDKLQKLKDIAVILSVTLEEIAYIGDDLNDIECMKSCGYSGCPVDAVDGIKEVASFISRYTAGNGAVREFIEEVVWKNQSIINY